MMPVVDSWVLVLAVAQIVAAPVLILSLRALLRSHRADSRRLAEQVGRLERDLRHYRTRYFEVLAEQARAGAPDSGGPAGRHARGSEQPEQSDLSEEELSHDHGDH